MKGLVTEILAVVMSGGMRGERPLQQDTLFHMLTIRTEGDRAHRLGSVATGAPPVVERLQQRLGAAHTDHPDHLADSAETDTSRSGDRLRGTRG